MLVWGDGVAGWEKEIQVEGPPDMTWGQQDTEGINLN